jgi:type 1 glutamine amidotransferase
MAQLSNRNPRSFQSAFLGLLVCAIVISLSIAAETPTPPPPAKTTARIALVTGIDYPGHKWEETSKALMEELAKDKRLKVDLIKDPAFLGTKELNQYDAVIIHFMPWEKPSPGPKAGEALKAYIKSGKGMVVTHFACGAFNDWPPFVEVAGRVYDPKLPPHDPYAKFKVEVRDTDHPITKGLEPFEVTDELYTCLAGETKIRILETAKSVLDKKDYAMAFVLEFGKGRVFNTPLGHDAQVYRTPAVARLMRRAVAWTAGLPVIDIPADQPVALGCVGCCGAGTESVAQAQPQPKEKP